MKLKNPVQNAILFKYPTGNIYQGFGENIALYMNAIGTKGHNGIDIVKEFRTPLIACFSGKVVSRKDDPTGYGKHIKFLTDPDENGDFLEVVYGHLDEIYNNVKLKGKVEEGQIIGYMGNTGFVISGNTPYWGNAPAGKGVHLHFGIRECSTKNTGWKSTYDSKDSAYIKNYENGFKGSIDPLKYIEVDSGTAKVALQILGTMVSVLKKMEEILKGRIK